MSRIPWVAAATTLGLSACIEYNLWTKVTEGDTGTPIPDEDPPVDTDADTGCFEASDGWQDSLESSAYGGGSDTGAWCTMTVRFEDTADTPIVFDDWDIAGFSIVGLDSSEDATGMSVRGVGIYDVEIEDLGTHFYPYYGHYYADYLTAATATSPLVWRADATGDDLGTLNDCHDDDSCRWEAFYIEIWDPEAPIMSDLECKGKYIPTVAWCPEWTPKPKERRAYSGSERRRTALHSHCAPGSGRFQLVPTFVRDRDDDDLYGVELVPMQMTGGGSYSGSAWLRSVDFVENVAETAWIFGSAADLVTFWPDDRVRWPIGRLPILAGSATFLGTEVPGAARFALEEVGNGALAELQVDLGWVCAPPSAAEAVDDGPGYSISLASLGCTDAWVQKLTIRPGPFHGATEMIVEPYGQPSIGTKVPLDPVALGDHFSYDADGFTIEGIVKGRNPTTGATVTLIKAEYDGVAVCDPGTYFLPKEQ